MNSNDDGSFLNFYVIFPYFLFSFLIIDEANHHFLQLPNFKNILEDEDSNGSIILPTRHLRCTSHTLSSLGTTDYLNAIKMSLACRIHRIAIEKCTSLWNMSRRPKSSETIKGILGI